MRGDGWQAVPTLGGILHPPPLLLGAFHLGPDNVKGGILLWTQTDICLLLSDVNIFSNNPLESYLKWWSFSMPASVFHIHCQRNTRRGPCPLLHCAPLSPCVGSPDQFFNHWRFYVNCYLTAKRESIDIECDSRKRRAHRNTEHSHRATLGLIFHYGEAISPPAVAMLIGWMVWISTKW